MNKESLVPIIENFQRGYNGNIPLSYRVADHVTAVYGSEAEGHGIEGGYHAKAKKVVLIASEFDTAEQVERTLRHEVLGHYGLNTFSPDQKRELLEEVLKTREEPTLKPVWDYVSKNYSAVPDLVKAEEVFAFVAESKHSYLQRSFDNVNATLQKLLRETGLSSRPLTLSELRVEAQKIAKGIRNGERVQRTFPKNDFSQFRKDEEAKNDKEFQMKNAKSPKQPYHERVGQQIIDQLKKGTAPWQKPWKPGEYMIPHNPTTGKAYKGINHLVLSMSGYSDPRWVTYNQAKANGWQVKKGAKSEGIQYWKFQEQRNKTDENGKPVLDADGKPVKITVKLERPKTFYANVFNAQQIDGVPELKVDPVAWDAHERAEKILLNSGADISHDQADRAFYTVIRDEIHLPDKSLFDTSDAYYATALHELGHWTGHSSRLDRDLSHPFGSEGYAKEELRAEIGSFMFNSELGLGHDPSQHIAYVGSWIKALEEDPMEIMRAAADAEKIKTFVLDLEQQQELTEEQALNENQVQGLEKAGDYLARIHGHEVSETDKAQLVANMNNGDAPVVAAITFASENKLPLSNEGLIYSAFDTLGINKPPTSFPSVHATQIGPSTEKHSFIYRISSDNAQAANKSFYGEIGLNGFTGELVGESINNGESIEPADFNEFKAVLKSMDRSYLSSSGLGHIIEAHDRLGVEPEVYTSLQQAHTDANPGYSPLETWSNLRTIAEENGLTAKVEINHSTNNFAPPWIVTFSDKNSRGSVSDLQSDIFLDGKSYSTFDGERYSKSGTFASTDSETQRRQLEGCIDVYREAEKTLEARDLLKETGEPGISQPKEITQAEQFAELQTNLSTGVINEGDYQEATQDLLGVRLPADWSGDVQIRALTEIDIVGGEKQINWAESDAQAQFFGVYAKETTGPEMWLADYPDRQAAEELGDTLKTLHSQATGLELPETNQSLAEQSREANMTKAGSSKRSKVPGKDRFYLAVPYEERGKAKELGASWDASAKSWYMDEAFQDKATFEQWLPDANRQERGILPQEEFKDELQAAGFKFEHGQLPDMDGKRHRVPLVDDKPGMKSGMYVGYLDGRPAGFYENHKSGVKSNWKAKGVTLSPEQKNAMLAQAEQKKAQRAAALLAQHKHQAKRCQQLWAQLKPVTSDNAYLMAKGINLNEMSDTDLKQDKKGRLVVPIRDEHGDIWAIQRISANSFKTIKKGSRKAGGFNVLNSRRLNSPNGVIMYAEGLSTAATLAMSHPNNPVISTIDAGNMPVVAEKLKRQYPNHQHLFCGDDDRFNSKGNKGRDKAEEAAGLVSGVVVFPRFIANEKKHSDFNDLYLENGLDVVKAQLAGSLGRLQAQVNLDRREQRKVAQIKPDPKERDKEKVKGRSASR